MSAVATVLGGFWPENGVSSLTQVQGTGPNRRRVAQALGTRGLLGEREIMETLNGAAAGSAASKTLSRIVAAEELGGVRAIETVTIIGRNTAAADVTRTNADFLSLSSKTYDPTPVANGDGNPLGTR